MPPNDTATAIVSDSSSTNAVAAHADRRLLIDGQRKTFAVAAVPAEGVA